MKSLQLDTERALGTYRPNLRLIGALLTGLVSTAAFAAEGEGVQLSFAGSDKLYLFLSLLIGLVGIGFSFFIAKGIATHSRGGEGMQEVQNAIEDGARAYLKKQISAMVPYILVLAVLIFFLYKAGMGATAALVSLTFIAGVVSSYVSGYAGMLMAVKANARVAFAALESNKKALEIAFKAGSVAGLMTVGVGLACSAAILIAAPKIATILLVGYGFGGSLAALFMRVGGGIYTKAADVGADLVGKVEKSLPEDSPRNPATIADNVGDNVGDCAGMAADVFESYEVMLVATIVLGAATSMVLDASVWPKLIVFAIAACGFGIIASMIGINTVSGNDDLDSDPLKPILKGFRISAVVSAIGVTALAALLLQDVKAQDLLTSQASTARQTKQIVAIRDEVAVRLKKEKTAVTLEELKADQKIKDLKLDTKQNEQKLQGALMVTPEALESISKNDKGLTGYSQVSADEIKNVSFPALRYAMQVIPTTPTAATTTPKYETVADRFAPKDKDDEKLVAVKLTLKQEAPATGGQPAQKAEQTMWVGPITQKVLDEQIKNAVKNASAQGGKMEIIPDTKSIVPVSLYYNRAEDKFLAVASAGVDDPSMYQPLIPMSYFKKSVSDMEALDKQIQANPTGVTMPEAQQLQSAAAVVTAKAEWWRFAIAVVFGIFMAIGIEALTNYYVGAGKKPTQEVAGVAGAGPAPMIIQGFAYGAESSVFMVLAIVIALMVPLFLFPVALFGSMILGFYGIALVGLGLLTTTAYILAMDTFGPISDNAQGVFEMSGEGHDSEYGSKSLQRLDAAGNTTKALTKGFAITTAVVAAVALFQSFVESAKLESIGLRLDVPEIFMGLLIGAAAPLLFVSFSINAVGRAAVELMNECRRQFRENPGIIDGTSKPDYGRCVSLVTAAAQKELLGPGILAICLPIAVGFGFSLLPGNLVTIGSATYNLKGAQALGGFLAGAIAVGQLMAVLLSNSGGMWDNAKKIIEDRPGGKGTEEHKAAVVCDTVGDPFKDTAGPALNPLIKVMNLVALLVVSIVIQGDLATIWRVTITLIAAGLIVFAFMRSKRGSLADQMGNMNG